MPQLKIDLVVDDKGSLVLAGFGSKVDKVMWSGKASVRALSSELAIAGVGLTALAGTVGMVGSRFVGVTAESERLKASLDTITKGQGAEWFEKLNDWALKMPVNTNEAIKTFQLLRSMGLQPTIKDMTTLVDTSAAMGGQAGTLEGIARALGQIQTKGKVSAEELMQLAERGIPAYEILQEKLGLTKEQVANIGTAGIDANKAVMALLEGMNERYGGLSDKLNNLWSGQIESLRSYGDEFMRLVMESGPMKEMENGLGDLIKKLDEWKEDGTLKEWASETGEAILAVQKGLIGFGGDLAPTLSGIGSAIGTTYDAMKKLEGVGGPSVGEWGLIGWALFRGGPQAALIVGALVMVNNKLAEFGIGARGILNDFNGKNLSGSGTWLEQIEQASVRAIGGLKLLGVNVDGLKYIIDKFNDGEGESHVFDSATAASGEAAKKIQADIKDTGSTWQEEWKKMEAAAAVSAKEQEAAQGQALKAMRDQYDKYASEVMELQRKIAGSERNLAAELRAMSRTGMSDLGAWKDRKREAEEYYQAAKKAAEANNFDLAAELAKQSKEAYADLNEEVKDGETVQVSSAEGLKAAMAGVSKAGQLNIDIMKKQQAEAAALANELNKQSGGKFGAVAIDESTEATVRFQEQTKELTQHWETMWETVGEDGHKVLTEIAGEINKLDGSTITIYTKHVEKDSAGGPVGGYAAGGALNFLGGGSLPGYGGGDRRHILGEDGEVMIRKEMVRAAGMRAALAFNAGRWDVVMAELAGRFAVRAQGGGDVWQLANSRSAYTPQRLAEGGAVRSAGRSGEVNSYHLNVSFAGEVSPMSQGNARANARLMLRELQSMQRMRS